MNSSVVRFVFSMLIFGTIGIIRRLIPLPSALLAFFRGILGALYLFLFIRITGRKKENMTRKSIVLLVLTGALIGFNWIFLFESYRFTSVSVATMCYYMQPTMVILLSPFFLGERLTFPGVLSAVTAVIGMYLISGRGSEASVAGDERGILFGLAAAALYAAVVILNKKIEVKDDYVRTMVQLFAASVTVLPYVLATVSPSALRPDAETLVLVLLVGIFHTGFAYSMYFGSMKNIPAQSVAILSYIDPLSALVFSALFLKERMTLSCLAGCILILGSALISGRGEKKERSAPFGKKG